MDNENEQKATEEKQQPEVEKEYKLSEDSARELMQDFLDSYDIDPADLAIENGPEWVATVVNRLVRAVRGGHLEINSDGTVVQHYITKDGVKSTITYGRMNGIAMKVRSKTKGDIEKDAAMMCSLGNIASPSLMLAMDVVDISRWQRLAQLFMVV